MYINIKKLGVTMQILLRSKAIILHMIVVLATGTEGGGADLYSRGNRFESWLGYQLYWLMLFICFLSPSTQIPGQYIHQSS
jgi:hypothetical protein